MAQMHRPDLLARLKAEKARPHHYAVAHRALPAAFFADPQMFLEAATRACPSFFERLWVQIGKKLAKPDRLPATGLDCQVRRSADDVAVAVITLPAAAFITEAHFVAAAFRPAAAGRERLCRYFTLEQGFDRVVFCEWTPRGEHMNHGPLTSSQVAAFWEQIAQVLDIAGWPPDTAPAG